MGSSSPRRLALAEDATIRLRLESILNNIGPRLDRRHANPIDHVALAKGLRMEAAIQGTVSGGLAIENVAPCTEVPATLSRSFQEEINNSTDGGYDWLDGSAHLIAGPLETCRTEDRAQSQTLTRFVRAIGIGESALGFWWHADEPTELQDEIFETGVAAHIYLTTERFGRAPPIQQLGRDGTLDDLRAPDIVNTIEHLEAQAYNLRPVLMNQKYAVQEMLNLTEDILVSAYDVLYADAPNSDVGLSRRFQSRDGALAGGREHMRSWINERLRQLGGDEGRE